MKLKTWMKRNGITFRDMGIKVGVGHTSIYKYCSGDRTPKYNTAVKIEKITKGDVSVKELMSK